MKQSYYCKCRISLFLFAWKNPGYPAIKFSEYFIETVLDAKC